MRKLLAILGAVGLTATGTTSAVVSCDSSDIPTPPTPTPPQDDKIDLAKYNGQVLGTATDQKNSSFADAYSEVQYLKRGILFILNIQSDDLDNSGVVIKSADSISGSKSAPLSDDTILDADKYYFATFTANENSETLKGTYNGQISSGGKFDLSTWKNDSLKNISTDIAISSSDGSIETDETNNAATDAVLTKLKFEAGLLGVELSDFKSDNFDLSNALFTLNSDTAKLSDLAKTANNNLVCKTSSHFFENTLNKSEISINTKFNIKYLSQVDITLKDTNFTSDKLNTGGVISFNAALKVDILGEVRTYSDHQLAIQKDVTINSGVDENTSPTSTPVALTLIQVNSDSIYLSGSDRTPQSNPLNYTLIKKS